GVRGDPSAPGRVEVHAQRNGREILVHGRASARLLADCVRCNQGLPIDVETDLATLYAPTETAPRDAEGEIEYELDPELPDREYYSGDSLTIDDLVRDYL